MGSGLCFSYPFQFSSRAAGFAGPLPSPRQPADRCDVIPRALCHCMVLLFSSNDLGDAFSYSHKGRLIIIPLDGHTLRATRGLWCHIRMHFASHVAISRTIGLCHKAYIQFQADTASQRKKKLENLNQSCSSQESLV